MGLFPVPDESLPIVWQNTIVDIEPTSRYSDEARPSDTATVNTTLVLKEPLGGRHQFLVPGLYEQFVTLRSMSDETPATANLVTQEAPQYDELVERLRRQGEAAGGDEEAIDLILRKMKRVHVIELELAEGSRLIRFFTRMPLVQEDDGTYKFSMFAPYEFARFEGKGDFSVLVLLPRAARGYEEGPLFDVKIRSWSDTPEPQVFGQGDLPALGGRAAVSWYWQKDPRLEIIYGY